MVGGLWGGGGGMFYVVLQVPNGSLGVPIWWPLKVWDLSMLYTADEMHKIWTAMQRFYGLEVNEEEWDTSDEEESHASEENVSGASEEEKEAPGTPDVQQGSPEDLYDPLGSPEEGEVVADAMEIEWAERVERSVMLRAQDIICLD